MERNWRADVREYLAGHNTMTLATYGPVGPAAAGLFYASDNDLCLYFLSEKKAQHVVNLACDQRVAITIHEDYRDWRHIQGVQIRGHAHPIRPGLELVRAMELYFRKYPLLKEFIFDPLKAGERLTQKFGASLFLVVEPVWVRWIDNRRGFGFRQEWVLSDETLEGDLHE